jgi:hypothetical protein
MRLRPKNVAKSKKHNQNPGKLSLLPGLRWHGYLKILEERKDGYVVQFTAQSKTEWIYDHTTLTPKQLKDWTGWTKDGGGI